MSRHLYPTSQACIDGRHQRRFCGSWEANELQMSAERPNKRTRQACEPCRRKKSRCSGERPICSYCSRLRQNCFYADEPQSIGRIVENPPAPAPQPQTPGEPLHDRRLEDRLKFVEAKLAEVLSKQGNAHQSESRQFSATSLSPGRQTSRPHEDLGSSYRTLPTWEVIVTAAENYLLYCDCQPLPLFHRDGFVQSIGDRESEVLFAILALTVRFSEVDNSRGSHIEITNEYVEAARVIVMKSIFEGTVELSTLQSLCLLSLVDFSNGNTRRASIHSSLAMSLAHNAGLTSESPLHLPDKVRQERRRCFWSLFLLKRLHGADFSILDFSDEESFPEYPESTGNVPGISRSSARVTTAAPGASRYEDTQDKGIVAYAIQLSEVWFKITRYARRRGKPSTLPPWSPQSEYSIILAQQMEFETKMPYIHRFKPAEFSQKSTEELHMNRDYWGPWLFIQFLYHTNLCLLNHPLLLSLRLRNFKCVIPEIFLQHTSDLISSHASWIIHFIDMLQAKSFKVTDPFLGHCVAIVATIYLQESFVEDTVVRKEKQASFAKCMKFIRGFGEQWPHVSRVAEKLERLGKTVSSTYSTSDGYPQKPSRSLLIDLGQFWEILEYSSSSELPNAACNLFGSSLYSGYHHSTAEMAQTSALPEPDRVDRQDFEGSSRHGSTSLNPVTGGGGGSSSTSIGQLMGASSSTNIPPLLPNLYSHDELAVLTESFFHPRPEFEGNVEDWWSTGNL